MKIYCIISNLAARKLISYFVTAQKCDKWNEFFTLKDNLWKYLLWTRHLCKKDIVGKLFYGVCPVIKYLWWLSNKQNSSIIYIIYIHKLLNKPKWEKRQLHEFLTRQRTSFFLLLLSTHRGKTIFFLIKKKWERTNSVWIKIKNRKITNPLLHAYIYICERARELLWWRKKPRSTSN